MERKMILEKIIEENGGKLTEEDEETFLEVENSTLNDVEEDIQNQDDRKTEENLHIDCAITSEDNEANINELYERKDLSELQKIRNSKISEKNLVKNSQLEFIREQSIGLQNSRDNQSLMTLLIMDQLKEKQTEKSNQNKNNELEIVEAITKYKDLLDKGALTEDEFNEKKKQLLNKN